MKQLGRFLSILTWLLIIGGMVVISGGLMGRPLLVAAVPTTSMVPTLKPGDLIVVLPTWTLTHPGLGDIVVYRTPTDQEWIVHRIIDGNASDGFVLKGDANPVSDARRVFVRDMAGVVPQVNGSVLRLPQLGALRVSAGPLSSPILAGIALVIGVFLLAMDMQPLRVPHMRHRRHGRRHPNNTLSIYVGLAATAFITTLIPVWTLSSEQPFHYEIIPERAANVSWYNRFLPGEVHEEDVVIDNPSPLPLVVAFHSTDTGLTHTPATAVIGAGKSKTFKVRIDNKVVGGHDGVQRMGVFLPLVPTPLLVGAFQQSILLAGITCALVPTAVVLLLMYFDSRARQSMAQMRTKLWVRFRGLVVH